MNVARPLVQNVGAEPSRVKGAEPDPLIVLESATVARLGGEVALHDLTWTLRAGETWAVVGPVGSGKTTLAEVLLGRHRLVTGTIAWPLIDRLRAGGHPVAWPADVIRHVPFKEDSWRFSYGRHYYQQRFNFIESHDDLTLGDFLRSETAADDGAIRTAAGRLGVGDLLSLSLIKLSNGQMRRARIAKALLAHPELLILDDPFLGLDTAGRRDVADLLGELVRQGVPVLLITRPETLPAWVMHVLELDQQTIRWQGPIAEREEEDPEAHPLQRVGLGHPLTQHSALSTQHLSEPVIEMRGVTVAYDGRRVLHDVTWTVHAGERWAVVGPNGAGKSTLLSLICGDHPQAYANDVRLFGRRRGTGESIWDIKRRIGLVSPELHLYYSEPLTAAQVATTGFYDVLAYRPATPEQKAVVRELFESFGITALADRPFARLSTGEQRLVLLARALVKAPPVLILDEPFQGLDGPTVRRVRDWLDQKLGPDRTLIFVSHQPEEIPRTVNRRLRLEGGRVAEEELATDEHR